MAMVKCSVRWRPSGGRGEYEFVPADALRDRRVFVAVPILDILIDAEVTGAIRDGKPRLRKNAPNDRSKMHLVPLVMAMARLPEPRREDITGTVTWPLERKTFLVDKMEFDIRSDSAGVVILEPTEAHILHSEQVIDLRHRFKNIKVDFDKATPPATMNATILHPLIVQHIQLLRKGINDLAIRKITDELISLQHGLYGATNVASISEINSLQYTPLEDGIYGTEGRILTRLHSTRERDPRFVQRAKAHFKDLNGGLLFCECCGHNPLKSYGPRGESRIEAHHKSPVEQMLPDTVVRPEDLAMVCPNCHDIIHAKRPWVTIEHLKEILEKGPYSLS